MEIGTGVTADAPALETVQDAFAVLAGFAVRAGIVAGTAVAVVILDINAVIAAGRLFSRTAQDALAFLAGKAGIADIAAAAAVIGVFGEIDAGIIAVGEANGCTFVCTVPRIGSGFGNTGHRGLVTFLIHTTGVVATGLTCGLVISTASHKNSGKRNGTQAE